MILSTLRHSPTLSRQRVTMSLCRNNEVCVGLSGFGIRASEIVVSEAHGAASFLHSLSRYGRLLQGVPQMEKRRKKVCKNYENGFGWAALHSKTWSNSSTWRLPLCKCGDNLYMFEPRKSPLSRLQDRLPQCHHQRMIWRRQHLSREELRKAQLMIHRMK